MKNEIKIQGLCFRCEHRAKHLDSKKQYQPRCECGMIESSVCCCYMYQPVKPVVTKIHSNYKKHPRFGPWMMSAREVGIELLDGKIAVIDLKKGKACLYWVPNKK